MSTYVMADIHGEIDRYHAMLDLINFSADDQLYIIGDIIDRGSEGLTILQEIMDKGNVHFILGNHEDMMLGTLSQHSYPGARTMWKQNGGDRAMNAAAEKCKLVPMLQLADMEASHMLEITVEH